MVNGVILASQDVVNSLLTCRQTTENSFLNTFDVAGKEINEEEPSNEGGLSQFSETQCKYQKERKTEQD